LTSRSLYCVFPSFQTFLSNSDLQTCS
jgi:hypothetical protein